MSKTLKDRINYATRVIREGRATSRQFDGCFEMGDGDDVVAALVKRAAKCPTLKANLPRYIAQSSIEKRTASAPGQWVQCEPMNQADREKGIVCIVDRATGHDVAECKAEYAPLIAALPRLLAALEDIACENPDNLSDRDELIRCATVAKEALMSITNPQTA